MATPNEVSISNLSLWSKTADDASACIEIVMKDIRNTINTEQRENSMTEKTFNNLKIIDDFRNRFTHHDERKLLGNKLAKCNAGLVLIQYMNLLTKDGKCYPLEGYILKCYKQVLLVCLNFTDASRTFSTSLCENGIISVMLSILKEFQGDFLKNEVKLRLAELAMTVLHNCVRVTVNKKYYCNEPNMVQVVVWYAKHTSQEVDKDLALLSIITLAEIVDEKNNDIILADETIIQTILNLLGETLNNSKHRAEGYSATELISGLTRLANNNKNSEVIVEHGILKYVRLILKKGNEAEKTAAVEAVWILAFSDKNKKIILSDCVIISALKAASQPSDLQRAADYALWVLNQQVRNSTQPAQEEQKEAKSTETVSMENKGAQKDITSSGEPSKHIMISHSHGDCRDRMIKLKNMLQDEGYRVWIDAEKMKGNMVEAMAKAVENAAVVLMSMSQNYKDSTFCRSEAEYAYYARKVPIIPLKVEDNYKPDGWLGFIAGSNLHHKFTNTSNFNEEFKKLTEEIGNRGKKIHSSNVTVVDAPPPLSRKTVECCCF